MADDSLSASGVYAIRNTLDGKVYVGSTGEFNRRFISHKHRLRKGDHSSRDMQAAWSEHGEQMFVFEILEVTPNDRRMLIEREQHYIDSLGAASGLGYNRNRFADSNRGMRHSEDAKRRISEATRGVPKPEGYEPAHKGKKLPPEWVAKVAAANTGKIRSAETKAKISQAALGNTKWLGKTHTAEAKAKISARAKLRTPRTGWNHTEEMKQAMREARVVAVEIGGVVYSSYKIAAAAVGCHPSKIGRLVKAGKARRVARADPKG